MYCCPYLPPVLVSASSGAGSPQATAINQAGTEPTAISVPCCSNSPVHLPVNYRSSFAFPCGHFVYNCPPYLPPVLAFDSSAAHRPLNVYELLHQTLELLPLGQLVCFS